MGTHNIGFYEDLTKIIFELSSNMHIISSSASNHLVHPSCKNITKSESGLDCGTQITWQ